MAYCWQRLIDFQHRSALGENFVLNYKMVKNSYILGVLYEAKNYTYVVITSILCLSVSLSAGISS
jgi:hypothetical protein